MLEHTVVVYRSARGDTIGAINIYFNGRPLPAQVFRCEGHSSTEHSGTAQHISSPICFFFFISCLPVALQEATTHHVIHINRNPRRVQQRRATVGEGCTVDGGFIASIRTAIPLSSFSS